MSVEFEEMTMDNRVKETLAKMTLEEKISLCNGTDFWHSRAFEKYGIPFITMSDGPHGLRVQKGDADMLGVNVSEPATCFPTAVASGASWDRGLLKEEGKAIGEESSSLRISRPMVPCPAMTFSSSKGWTKV